MSKLLYPLKHITYMALLTGVVLQVFTFAAMAQSPRTEHTYRLDQPENAPAATLKDVAWMAGSWEGEAFGDKFEEVWNPPSSGTMVGMWKLLDGDGVKFYELMLIVEEENSLSLKVKHFSADFTAWEEKPDYVNFRLVKLESDAVHFSGLSFYRINENEMHAYLVMRQGEEIHEEQLIFRRRF
jgi:hypothetical protein